MEDFRLFLDQALQIPVDVDDNDVISLGKLKAGETKTYTFYIYNSSVFPHEEMKYEFDKNDITVIEAPKELLEKRSAKFIIKWKPKVDIEVALKTTLDIDSYRVISP